MCLEVNLFLSNSFLGAYGNVPISGEVLFLFKCISLGYVWCKERHLS